MTTTPFTTRTIGIDAIALAVPDGYLDLADLAAARSVPAAKYVEGLGVSRMAVARPDEDPVSLAASAARRLFETSGVSPSTIGLCVVGTETGVDHSKPVAAYLHRLLGLPERCRVHETKHACYGGTAGLLAALDWIGSGAAKGRKALVICTDIARYPLHSPGEPTQGAGAVALLVSAAPRLVALDHGVCGSYAKDVDDFWRPLYSKDAFVDGQHSVKCYLDAIAGAYATWCESAREAGIDPSSLARRCYHVPYGKMARKAHRHLMMSGGATEAQADATFSAEVARSLDLPSLVGNVYTGSLYLALASLLDAEAGLIEGQRIGLFSYGSGCAAEFFSGTVAAGAARFVDQLRLAEPLAHRTRLTVAQYEAIRHADADADRRPVEHGTSNGAGNDAIRLTDGRTSFLGVREDRRIYG